VILYPLLLRSLERWVDYSLYEWILPKEVPEVVLAFVELESGGPHLEPAGWQATGERTRNTRGEGPR
jgi:hypothetical protein